MGHGPVWEVLCLGDSRVKGRLGADWVKPLEASTEAIAARGAPVKLINGGADTALAESLPLRLHEALRQHPEPHALVILLGTNDILAHLHPLPEKLLKMQNGFRGEHLGPKGFAETVAASVRTLPRGLPVAVLAVPPIGEDLDSAANATVRKYNAALEAAVARLRTATFVDLYAVFARTLRASGHAAGPVKPASVQSNSPRSVLGPGPTAKVAPDDGISSTATLSRQSSVAGSLASGSLDEPIVLKFDGRLEVLADKPGASVGRGSIGKTSLAAAAAAAGSRRTSGAAGAVGRSSANALELAVAAVGGSRSAEAAPKSAAEHFGEEAHTLSLAELQEQQRREASMGFSMPTWPLQVAVSVFRHWVCRASWDSIAASNGLLLMTDNVSFSERGARIVADEVRAFLNRVLIPSRPSAYAGAGGHLTHQD